MIDWITSLPYRAIVGLGRLLGWIVSMIPIIGELPNSHRASIIAAAKETGYSTAFSTVPIWFFPVFSSIFLTTNTTLLDSIYSTVSQGDLYIYASSLVGPLIFAITSNYMTWDKNNNSPNSSRIGNLTFAFPYGTWFFLISLLICTLAAMCFGVMRFSTTGAITAKLNVENLFWFSVFIYLFSTACLFCVSVYRNELANGKYNDADNTRQFLKDWNNRNG